MPGANELITLQEMPQTAMYPPDARPGGGRDVATPLPLGGERCLTGAQPFAGNAVILRVEATVVWGIHRSRFYADRFRTRQRRCSGMPGDLISSAPAHTPKAGTSSGLVWSRFIELKICRSQTESRLRIDME
jgi:hypothetical protein